MKTTLLLGILWLGTTSAYAQNKVPSLDVAFGNVSGCLSPGPTPAVFSVENGAYFMGQSSCDYYHAYALSPTSFGISDGMENGGPPGVTAVSSHSVFDYYNFNYCLVPLSQSSCNVFWSGPILPLSTSGTWAVGGNNFIYHAGNFFDPTQGIQTNWVNVITGSRGDAFVLGYAATGFPTKKAFQPTGSGLLLAEFSNVDQSVVYATYLDSLGLNTIVGIAQDKGGNIYLSGSGPFGPVLAKLSPNLPQKLVYRKLLSYGGGPIAVDPYGQIYMRAGSSGVPMVNAPQPNPGGASDSSIVVLSPKADRIVYSSYVGGDGEVPVGVSVVGYPNYSVSALLGGLENNDNWDTKRAPLCQIDPGQCGPWFYQVTFGPLLRSTLPATLNFSSRRVGTTTVLRLPFKNIGNSPVSVAGANLSGSSAFTLRNTSVGSLKPDATCMIVVAFTPTSTGGQTGFLTVSSDSLDSPQTVQLSGTGK